MMLTDKENKILKETQQRNTLRYLKRLYSKLKEHPELVKECQELKTEIDSLEKELAMI